MKLKEMKSSDFSLDIINISGILNVSTKTNNTLEVCFL